MATLRAMPVLDVRDVRASEAFYARLGFASHGTWGDPPSFAIVQRGDVTLALSLGDRSAPVPLNHGWAAYIYVDDVAALHAELGGEGIALSEMRSPEHYGCRDFDLTDADGHCIAFGQSLHPVPGPGLETDRGKG